MCSYSTHWMSSVFQGLLQHYLIPPPYLLGGKKCLGGASRPHSSTSRGLYDAKQSIMLKWDFFLLPPSPEIKHNPNYLSKHSKSLATIAFPVPGEYFIAGQPETLFISMLTHHALHNNNQCLKLRIEDYFSPRPIYGTIILSCLLQGIRST